MVYDTGMDRPGFINPSSEPLKASLMLQEKLEADVRKSVNLAVETLATRARPSPSSLTIKAWKAGWPISGWRWRTPSV